MMFKEFFIVENPYSGRIWVKVNKKIQSQATDLTLNMLSG